jgi:di/tricarboxylate transporter
MTQENILVLVILTIAVILFISDRLRVDLVAMLVLITLKITGLVTVEEAFSGFASPAVITVWSVYIVSGALFRTGVADILANFMIRMAGHNYLRLLLVIMVTVGIMSSFMNNIGAVAILLPAVVSVGRKINVAPSKLLIPMAFTSLLGGNMTLIGTPPNILATSIMQTYGGIEPFGFFDFVPMGFIVLIVGIIYFLVVGNRLLPEHKPGEQLSDSYHIREYLSEVRIGETSTLVGKTLVESKLGRRYNLNVLNIHRCENNLLVPSQDPCLEIGDILLVQGKSQDILKAGEELALEGYLEWDDDDLYQENQALVEVTLSQGSSMEGQTLKQANFRARFGLTVLAIQHRGRSISSNLADVPLQFGDALLIQGPTDKVAILRRDEEFLILETPPIELKRTRKAPLAVLILASVIILASLRILDVSTGMLIGAVLMILTGALNMDEAYQAIEWKSVFLIAGMLPMGIAMQNSGTALFLAQKIIQLVGGWGTVAVLMGVFLLTAMITEVMSNAAAAVLLTPIAIDAARNIGANPQTFVMVVVIAAATSFLMPIGHQANVLIFGPGGYKFSDYFKVGFWLTVIIFFVVLIFLPIIWPL